MIEKAEAVSKMQKYIENNIDKKITLYSLSKNTGYSMYYSLKIFKSLTGKSPFEYIRSLRLTKAAFILRDTNTKIIDVAFDFLFDSHEGFTRAFSREFGITPYKYQRSPPPVKLFIPHYVKNKFISLNNKNNKGEKIMDSKNTVFVQVVERPKRKLILKRGRKAKNYFDYCEEVGCDVWGILLSIKEALYEPIGVWLPCNMIIKDTGEYAQGVEVPYDYKGVIPNGFDIIDLEETLMMIFQGEPFEEENLTEACDKIDYAIKNYKPEVYGFKLAKNKAPRFQLEPQCYRGYIEGIPVERV